MDFGLSQEQVLLKETVKRFLTDQCPTARVRQIMESDPGHDPRLWKGLAEIGILGLTIPARYDGLERELLDLALAAEELGYAATPGPFLGHVMAAVALTESADEALCTKWLPALGSGEAVATVAFGEEESEWDAGRMKSTVRGGRLNGRKMVVPYPELADLTLVVAPDESGPGVWVVERDAPGVECTRLTVNDLTRRISIVGYHDTPAVRLCGREPLQRMIDAGLVLIAADAFGGARRCLEMSVGYAQQREQFGKVIGAFQAIKHRLADMATDLEPALSFYWYAAHAFDQIREQSTRHAAMAKAHLCDLYDRVVRDATELHGGIGFTWEFDLHLWFRRSIFDRSFLGSSSYLRSRAADLAGW